MSIVRDDLLRDLKTGLTALQGFNDGVEGLLTTLNTYVDGLETLGAAATPAGGNLIGKVGIDQTTPGTTNAVVATGNVAAGVAEAGNALKVGGRADSAIPASVAAGQRVQAWWSLAGALMIAGIQTAGADGASNTNILLNDSQGGAAKLLVAGSVLNAAGTWDRQRGDVNATIVRSALGASSWAYAGATGGILNTADVAIAAAAGVGVRNFLHSLWFKNTAAVASEIVVKDGATIIWRGHVSVSMTFGEMVIFDPPLRGTANTALNVAMITNATATVVSAQGSTGA